AQGTAGTRARGRAARPPAEPEGVSVVICDVGPRDGLQNHQMTLSPEERATLCNRLAACGLPRGAAASFVHPQRVPQMAGAEDVLAALEPVEGTVFSALVLNHRGL